MDAPESRAPHSKALQVENVEQTTKLGFNRGSAPLIYTLCKRLKRHVSAMQVGILESVVQYPNRGCGGIGQTCYWFWMRRW